MLIINILSNMKKRTIRNLDTLEKEIYKRKLRLKEIESTLGNNVDHMKENFGQMALQTIMGSVSSSPMGIAGNLALKAINNEKLQNSLAEFVERLAEKIGDGIQKVTDKILHKK
jgi:hypothetical protein